MPGREDLPRAVWAWEGATEEWQILGEKQETGLVLAEKSRRAGGLTAASHGTQNTASSPLLHAPYSHESPELWPCLARGRLLPAVHLSGYVAADSVFAVSPRPFALGRGSRSPECPFLPCPAQALQWAGGRGAGAIKSPRSGLERWVLRGGTAGRAAFGAGTLGLARRHRWTRRVRGWNVGSGAAAPLVAPRSGLERWIWRGGTAGHAAFGAGTLGLARRHRWTRRVRGALPGGPRVWPAGADWWHSGDWEQNPSLPQGPRRLCWLFCPAMQWVVKLYLLGALLSLLSVLLGLMDSLGGLMAPQGLEQCLSGPWTEPEGSLAEGQPKILQGQATQRTNKAFGSYL
ncbi:uncharacterized protein LOC123378685 [Mauremys mutica]|uniref:uncharacterized protein LOC123378685 n=1 Tax=Mauremys mutica TaxID=74926 RepID=UPI001D14CF12|nr:uncharacterized protein LOC123378685 [Mauremys mutica]